MVGAFLVQKPQKLKAYRPHPDDYLTLGPWTNNDSYVDQTVQQMDGRSFLTWVGHVGADFFPRVRPNFWEGWSGQVQGKGRRVGTQFAFEPTCAYCTVGSYASLSVCPSVCPSVCHTFKNSYLRKYYR